MLYYNLYIPTNAILRSTGGTCDYDRSSRASILVISVEPYILVIMVEP